MRVLHALLTAQFGLAALTLRHRLDLVLAVLGMWVALGTLMPRGPEGRRFWRPDPALSLLFWLISLVLCADALAPYDPTARLNQGDLLGLDRMGRDQFSRLLLGQRVSVTVALTGSLLAMVLGTAMAGLLAFGPKPVRAVARLLCQTWLALPAMLFFCLGIALVEQAGLGTLVVLLGCTLWLEPARMLEARALELRESAFVAVARMAGASEVQIFTREILPNLRPVLVVNLLLTFHAALLLESGLGFLGLGRSLGAPSLGSMIEQGAREMQVAPAPFLAAMGLLFAWLAALRGVASGLGVTLGVLTAVQPTPGPNEHRDAPRSLAAHD